VKGCRIRLVPARLGALVKSKECLALMSENPPLGDPRSRPDNESKRPSARVVHDKLRQRILQGQIDVDVPISQVGLAREMGVSRTPLREALRMLQAEGLVSVRPNHMIRVARLSVDDLEQAYALRIVLEAFGIRVSVPRFSDDDLAELSSSLADVERASDEGDLDAWERAHTQFHGLLRRYAGPRLDGIARTLSDHTDRYRRIYMADPGGRAAALAEHRQILDACRAGDAPLASRHVARHLARTALTTAVTINPEYDPAAVRQALRFALASSEEGTVDPS
jgi:DNA-binding GntR family transcriptional regulator